MKKSLKVASIVFISALCLCGCAKEWESSLKDWESATSGLDRTVKIYPYGSKEPIATYQGDINLDSDDTGRVKFLLDGKRYIYYNVTAEVLEK